MAALGLAILYHAALGLALALLVWVVGAGWLAALGRLEHVHAYPLGLLTVLLAAALVLVSRWLALLSIPLVVVPLGLAWRARVAVGPAARLVAWSLPPIGGLAVSLGYFLHGPSRTLDSNTFGDVVWYVAKLASARQSLFPLHDLEVAGFHLWHAELGPTLLGAVVTKLPGTDPFLFQTSLLPAFLLASLACGFAVARPVLAPPKRLALALLGVGMVAYPSWLAESPPVALALPLAFSIFALVWSTPPAPPLAIVGAAVALDLLLTKGLVLVPLAILLAPVLAPRVRASTPRALAAAGIALVAALVVVLAARNSFWALRDTGIRLTPLDALRGLRSQLTTRSTTRLSPAFEVSGWILLAAALWRVRAWRLLAVLVVVLAWDWILETPYSIRIGLGVIALLSVLLFAQRPVPLHFVAAAGACLALAVWFRDFGGLREGLIATACLGGSLLSLLRPAGERTLEFHLGLYAAVGSAALLALSGHAVIALAALAACALAWLIRPPLALAGAAAAVVLAGTLAQAGSLRLGTYDTTLTKSDYDIWHRVSRLVPEGSLVFTASSTDGFDYYPAIAGRQLYLAGWYETRLQTERTELERRMRLNGGVLNGRPPGPEGSYRAYFAVVGRSRLQPKRFVLVYENNRFSLYRINAGRPSVQAR